MKKTKKTKVKKVAVATFKTQVPGYVKIEKKKGDTLVHVVGCDVELSDEKLGLKLVVNQGYLK